MSRLIELQRTLEDVSAAIVRAERAIAAHPDIPSGTATLRSFLKMREDCEREFLRETNALEKDVCSYRIIPEGHRATISGLTSVLNEFQAMFTAVYDALVNPPKKIAKFSDDVVQATALGFGYTFSGSIGVMMTLDNKRGLFGESESKLDDAMNGVFEIIKTPDQDGVRARANKYGLAAIRAAHKWADANAAAQFGTDIVWMRRENVRGRVALQRPEVIHLASIIGGATHTTQDIVYGNLRMFDADTKEFRINVDGKDYQGIFDADLASEAPTVPHNYRALIQITQSLIGDSGTSASYVLLNLFPGTDAP